MYKKYMNENGDNVPPNKIVVVPHTTDNDGFYKEIIEPLKGNPKRDWFTSHFYYCLPLTIGNQYGFAIKSLRDFDATWDGSHRDAVIEFLNEENSNKQVIQTGFSQGIITIQNCFALKTEPGINLMTIQPPNMFIPGLTAMTGVIETDNIKRDFTFNVKITVPNYTVKVRKGDIIAAFMPIPRYFVDQFDLSLITDIFDKEFHENEIAEAQALSAERNSIDRSKPHQSGRRYFSGVNTDSSKYKDHQKKIASYGIINKEDTNDN
jgi:hypothetical protein